MKSERWGQTQELKLILGQWGATAHSAAEWPHQSCALGGQNEPHRGQAEVWLGQRRHTSQAAHPEFHVQIAVGSHRILQEGVVNANQLIHRAANCGEELSHSSCVRPGEVVTLLGLFLIHKAVIINLPSEACCGDQIRFMWEALSAERCE